MAPLLAHSLRFHRKDPSAMKVKIKRSIVLPAAALLLLLGRGLSQNNSADSAPPDPYKPTLDRLESLTRQPEAEWRYHADVPHPEDRSLNDADWPVTHVENASRRG